MSTLLHLKWITNKDLSYGTWNSAQCYLPTWMGDGFGEEWIHLWTVTAAMKLKDTCSLEEKV